MAIEIIPHKTSKRKIKPHYLLTAYYMIGDADGDTEEQMEVALDNPRVERFVKILRKLTGNRTYSTIVLEEDSIVNALQESRITQSEFDFITPLMFEEYGQARPEFGDIIQSYMPGTYLVFQGINLEYVDENGVKFQTKFVKDKK